MDSALLEQVKKSGAQKEPEEWSRNELRMLRHLLECDHLAFTRYFLKKRDSNKFILSDHHKVMADTLERVLLGDIKRLIINVPPGFTKTEMAVINFIARGLALNPSSKYIHISYADSLAMQNSTSVRDVVTMEEYVKLWPTEIRLDANAKKAWYTKEGGGMLSVSSGGTITGFRAGRMTEGFSGAMIIDDPIKPDDAFSDTIRKRVNNRFTNTFQSRLAHDEVPIIVIMQRIHEDDPTGFLLRGGTGDMWHHLNLPAEIPEDPEDYPEEYSHGIPIEHNLPAGALWEYKKTIADLKVMRESDPYTTASQYDQSPTPLGGGLFKEDWWNYYEPNTIVPEYRFITGDTANKTKEHNDFSVFECWGYLDGNLYLLDLIRGKWEAPELESNFLAFWSKHFGSGTQTVGRLRFAGIEDKASGTGLIQKARREVNPVIPIKAIQRNKDKVTRAMDNIPWIAQGRIFLPSKSEWLSDFKDEFRKFTAAMTHKHDDQIDPLLDAIELTLKQPETEGGTW